VPVPMKGLSLLFIVYCVHVLYVRFDMCKINDSQSVIMSYNFGADWTKIQNSQHTSLAACCCIRVDFKIAAITFNLLIAEQSSYLRELLQLRRPSRSLRASNHNLLNIPRPRTAFGTAEFFPRCPSCLEFTPSCNH